MNPGEIGSLTRNELWHALYRTVEQMRSTAHFLHDEYQFNQERELYRLVNEVRAIMVQYTERVTA